VDAGNAGEVGQAKKPLGPLTVVIEVRGGVVQMVYADLPLDVVLVDWDNINDGDDAGRYGHDPLADLPEDTRGQVVKAVDPYGHLTQEQVKAIEQAAVECVVEDVNHDPIGTAKELVAHLDVEDMLGKISDDPEQRAGVLGFTPEDGLPGLPEDEDEEEYEFRTWVLAPGTNTWHAAEGAQASEGLVRAMCGLSVMQAGEARHHVGDPPKYADGGFLVCAGCVKADKGET
jgi:hypothetical protein